MEGERYTKYIGLNCSTQNICPSGTFECELPGIRVCVDIIKVNILKWDHPGVKWVLNAMKSLLLMQGEEEAKQDTKKGRPCDHTVRDWRNASTSQGMLRIVGSSSNEKLGETQGIDSPSEPREKSQPWSNTLVLDLWPLELFLKSTFLLF